MSAVFNSGLNIYRKTLKRVQPIHAGLHWLSAHTLIPALEAVKGIKTMPDDPLWFRFELLTQRHEAETLALIQQLVKPNMTVLDIGGHIGYYARAVAPLVGDGGKVISFEPHPTTVQTLRANVAPYKNVIVAQMAVSDQEGTAELFDYLMMSASGSLHYDESLRDLQKSQAGKGDIAPRLAQDMPVSKFSVRTVRIDDYLAELNIPRVDVIKMDIEGAEMSALRGMANTIQNSPKLRLIMEYNPQALSASGLDPVAVVEDVVAMGFDRVEAIETDGTLTDLTHNATLVEIRANALKAHMGVVNLLFTRG
jgi:FkbM family methyltransferase